MGFRADVPSLVEQALRDPSPLKVEMHLLETRWQFLTDSESCHHFDLTVLMIYGLKLQILERMQKFDEEKGERVLNRIYERSFDES